MLLSGGWDWAPYGTTFANGAHTFSKGIVRSVYLLPVNQIAIEHVVPQIFYTGKVCYSLSHLALCVCAKNI